jgi:hypothetical protein
MEPRPQDVPARQRDRRDSPPRRRPPAFDELPPRSDATPTQPDPATAPKRFWRWAYYARDTREQATECFTYPGGLPLRARGDGAFPPEVARELQKIASTVTNAGTLAEGSNPYPGEPLGQTTRETVGDADEHWPVATTYVEPHGVPTETAWTLVVETTGTVVETNATPNEPAPPGRPADSAEPTPARHSRPNSQSSSTYRHDDTPQTEAKHSGEGPTFLLLDTLALDTLIAAMAGPASPHETNYGQIISVIEVGIRPRTFVIKSVTLTIGTILNAHGFAVLSPACGRLTAKVLEGFFDLLLGPDDRHRHLAKALRDLEVAFYATDGRTADSPTFRSRLAEWLTGPHGPRAPSTFTPGKEEAASPWSGPAPTSARSTRQPRPKDPPPRNTSDESALTAHASAPESAPLAPGQDPDPHTTPHPESPQPHTAPPVRREGDNSAFHLRREQPAAAKPRHPATPPPPRPKVVTEQRKTKTPAAEEPHAGQTVAAGKDEPADLGDARPTEIIEPPENEPEPALIEEPTIERPKPVEIEWSPERFYRF